VEIILEDHLTPGNSSTGDGTLDLVRQAQAGDAGAFERLYRSQVGRIHALCIRMVNDPIRAETLTQDAFVKAWRQLHRFEGKSAFSTWLYRLAVNVVLMDLRSERRRRARLQSTGDLTKYNAASREPSFDTGMDLEAGIAALPDQARAVLILHDIEGYQHKEIGEMMGIATGTSKAHLHRARKLLKAMFASKP